MIQGISHVTIFVHDQDEALAFYTQKMGFELRTDVTIEGFRWVTVGPADQKDVDLALMPVGPSPMYDDETLAAFKVLMSKGAMGAGVFKTDDCQATYATLKDRGVEFMQPPAERPYGIEALLKDNSGNWFSLVQPHQHP